ncbi:MAG: hypothetical protein C3F06_02215 [Candidatus Methanoperedenaceae archaeon]|nr:MAG: hypothetical protein C3F06_02215 [Candidatus Methanoperedenaceae archaeon]
MDNSKYIYKINGIFHFNCILYLILYLVAIGPSYADVQNNLDITGGPDCINCHDTGGISNKTINVAYLNSTVHRNLNFDAIVSPELRADNRICWGCHQSDGTEPVGHPDKTTNPYGCIECHGRDNDIPPPHLTSGNTYPAPKTGQEIVEGYSLGEAPSGQNMTHKKDTLVGLGEYQPQFADPPDGKFYSRHSNPFTSGGYPGATGSDRNPNHICLNCHSKVVRDQGLMRENNYYNSFNCGVCHGIWGFGLKSHELSVTKCTDCHNGAVNMDQPWIGYPNFHYSYDYLVPPDSYGHIADIGRKINSSVHGSLVNDTTTGLPVNSKGCLICHTDANYTINYNGGAVEIIINEGSRLHVWNSEPYCTSCHALTGEQSLSGPTLPSHSFTTLEKNNNSICLECHGGQDKHGHTVTSVNGILCIACHSQDVNISLFGRHADINISDGAGNVTNNDCWTCHYQKDMSRSSVYLCESCHINSTGIVNVTNTSLIKSDLMHGMTTCKNCHAPSGYHQKGTAGPLGTVENVLRKIS